MASKKKPPTKQAKKAAKKMPSKVVSIDSGKTAPKRKPMSKLLVASIMRRGREYHEPDDIYSQLAPSPLAIIKHQTDVPSDRMINALIRLLNYGVPVRTAFQCYGIAHGQYLQWKARAQAAVDGGNTDANSMYAAYHKCFVAVQIAEAQGEMMATVDARHMRENVLAVLKTRYGRNWGGMAASQELSILNEAQHTEQQSDEEGSMILEFIRQTSEPPENPKQV